MSKFKLNEKGFIFIDAIFLTLIVSFMAVLILNGLDLAITSNRVSVIRMNAIHLANARMSEIEAYNDGRTSFQMPSDTYLSYEDLNYTDYFGISGTTRFNIETKMNTSSTDRANVTVVVTWTVNNNSKYDKSNNRNYEEITKDIWITKTST